MKRLFVLSLFLCLGAGTPTSRFVYVDIYIVSNGQPLAAWQVEFAAEKGDISLVGVEGGDSPAYAGRPPYYDPAALAGKRIILANYSVNANLPKGRFRAARLMLEVRGEVRPRFVTKLIAAANEEGKSVAAKASVVEGAAANGTPRSGL